MVGFWQRVWYAEVLVKKVNRPCRVIKRPRETGSGLRHRGVYVYLNAACGARGSALQIARSECDEICTHTRRGCKSCEA